MPQLPLGKQICYVISTNNPRLKKQAQTKVSLLSTGSKIASRHCENGSKMQKDHKDLLKTIVWKQTGKMFSHQKFAKLLSP